MNSFYSIEINEMDFTNINELSQKNKLLLSSINEIH